VSCSWIGRVNNIKMPYNPRHYIDLIKVTMAFLIELEKMRKFILNHKPLQTSQSNLEQKNKDFIKIL
jgi:hypothetical protein